MQKKGFSCLEFDNRLYNSQVLTTYVATTLTVHYMFKKFEKHLKRNKNLHLKSKLVSNSGQRQKVPIADPNESSLMTWTDTESVDVGSSRTILTVIGTNIPPSLTVDAAVMITDDTTYIKQICMISLYTLRNGTVH